MLVLLFVLAFPDQQAYGYDGPLLSLSSHRVHTYRQVPVEGVRCGWSWRIEDGDQQEWLLASV